MLRTIPTSTVKAKLGLLFGSLYVLLLKGNQKISSPHIEVLAVHCSSLTSVEGTSIVGFIPAIVTAKSRS